MTERTPNFSHPIEQAIIAKAIAAKTSDANSAAIMFADAGVKHGAQMRAVMKHYNARLSWLAARQMQEEDNRADARAREFGEKL